MKTFAICSFDEFNGILVLAMAMTIPLLFSLLTLYQTIVFVILSLLSLWFSLLFLLMNPIWKFPFSNVQLQWLEWIEIQENLTYNRTPVLIPSDIMTTKVSIKDAIITLKLCKDQKAITFWLKFDDEYDNITTSNHTEYSSQCIYTRFYCNWMWIWKVLMFIL